MLPLAIACEFLQPIPRRNTQILWPLRSIEQEQFPEGNTMNIGRESRRPLTQKELLSFSRPKALYHGSIITHDDIIVKRYYWLDLNHLTGPPKAGFLLGGLPSIDSGP
jgi:hypothetical protein